QDEEFVFGFAASLAPSAQELRNVFHTLKVGGLYQISGPCRAVFRFHGTYWTISGPRAAARPPLARGRVHFRRRVCFWTAHDGCRWSSRSASIHARCRRARAPRQGAEASAVRAASISFAGR